jgi:hypothetical protein
MITGREMLLVLALPFVLAGLVAAVAVWRRWPWLLPVAAGGGFMAGYVATNLPQVPGLPPATGSDWVMWVSAAAALVGAAAAVSRRPWVAPVLAGVAGIGAFVVARPLWPHAVSTQALWWTAILVGVTAVIVVGAASWATLRVPAGWAGGAMSVALAGAAVLVMSSHFRTMGVYGLAAAASMGAVAVAAFWAGPKGEAAARGLWVYGVAVLASLLVAGRLYADPGVTGWQLALMLLSPALLPVGALVPGRGWVKGVVALVAVGALVAAVAAPAALKAKRAAESPASGEDYSEYYRGG